MESERETENQYMAIHQLSQYLKTGWERVKETESIPSVENFTGVHDVCCICSCTRLHAFTMKLKVKLITKTFKLSTVHTASVSRSKH